jgi:hypothetical protein
MQPYVIVKGFIASTLVCPSGSRRLSSNIRASFCERTFARALPPLRPMAAAKVVHGARIEWGVAWHNGCLALTITRDNHRSGTRFTPRRAAGFNHQRHSMQHERDMKALRRGCSRQAVCLGWPASAAAHPGAALAEPAIKTRTYFGHWIDIPDSADGRDRRELIGSV